MTDSIPEGFRRHPKGGGLVALTATVAETAYVGPNARVSGNARVRGDAHVYGNAVVYGNARVFGDAHVYGNARVFGDARVYGDAVVSGNARVYGDAVVSGNAEVYGDAEVSGNAEVCRGKHTQSPLYIQGTRYFIMYSGDGHIRSGCVEKPFAWWVENVRRLAEEHDYTPEQIEEYAEYVNLIVRRYPA